MALRNGHGNGAGTTGAASCICRSMHLYWQYGRLCSRHTLEHHRPPDGLVGATRGDAPWATKTAILAALSSLGPQATPTRPGVEFLPETRPLRALWGTRPGVPLHLGSLEQLGAP
jgi:hypothetical protein